MNTHARFQTAAAMSLALSAFLTPSLLAQSDSPCCAGKRIVEDRANTFTSNLQSNATLAATPDGQFLALWDSRRQDNRTFGVFAQRYDAIGRPIGAELRINQYSPASQQDPAAAIAPDGTTWITWETFSQDGSDYGVALRRFATDGNDLKPLADEIIANQSTHDAQFDPAIAVNADGQALLTWCARQADGSMTIVARLFNADGSPATDELNLSQAGNQTDLIASSAARTDGSFVVTWARTDSHGNPNSIMARIVTSDGGMHGDEFAISLPGSGENIEPAIAPTDGNGFAVAWMQSHEAHGYQIALRTFDADAKPTTAPVVAAAPDQSTWLSGVALTSAADGRLLVSWNQQGEKFVEEINGKPTALTPSRIVAQTYTSDAKPVGELTRISKDENAQQALTISSNASRIYWNGSGRIAAAWNGHINDDAQGIGLTVHSPLTFNPKAPDVVERVAATIPDEDLAAFPVRNPDYKPMERDAGIQAEGPDHGFLGYMETEWQPPDPDIAAGPNHVVAVVNMRVAVFTHDGTEVFHEYLEDFFRGQGSDNFVFDPVAVWDPFERRFVIAVAERIGGLSRLVIAVTKTENPLDGWNKYGFDTDHIGTSIDFENLGVGPEAYYVTADYFGGQGNVIHIFEKEPMLVGDPTTMRHLNTSGSLLSLASTKSYDADQPAQYFATSWASRTNIRIYAVQNPNTSPSFVFTDVSVPYMENPPDAAQRGSSNRVPTIDRRIKNGIVRDGHLWLSHAIGEESTARVRWYEIDLRGWPDSGNTPVRVQMGTIDDGPGQHNWFPDIGVDAEGDVVITASRSSSNDYPYVARHIRKADDPAGTMRPFVTLKESAGPYTGGRWGDYSGIDEDPDQPGVFWSHNEFNQSGSSWRTWVGRIDSDRGIVLDVDQVIRGAVSTMNVTNCTPNDTVYFAYSFGGTSETYVPFLDVNIGLRNAQLIGTQSADANGNATMTRLVPNNAPQRSIWIQAAQVRNSSNIVESLIN